MMNMQNILTFLPGIIIGLTALEYCHALAAHKLGDNTAREMGRMTFNPIKHIDPIGFIFILIAGFGWAKPVQFDPENLRNPRRDKAIIAAAGPLSNLILALIFIAIVRGWFALIANAPSFGGDQNVILQILLSRPFVVFITIIYYAIMINLGLFVFNLLPLPPLDGSHIVFSGLNLRPETEHMIMKFRAPLLFIIIIFQNYSGITILPIRVFISAILRLFMPQLG